MWAVSEQELEREYGGHEQTEVSFEISSGGVEPSSVSTNTPKAVTCHLCGCATDASLTSEFQASCCKRECPIQDAMVKPMLFICFVSWGGEITAYQTTLVMH